MNLLFLKDKRFDKRLRCIPKWLTVPPLVLMLLSTIPAAYFGLWFATALDIPGGVPIKNAPHGGYWIVGFLVFLIASMIAGYVLGFFVDSLILRYCCHWEWRKIADLMLESKLPDEWSNRQRAPDA